MQAQSIIQIKRSGGVLSNSHLIEFIQGATDGNWTDAQCASLLMAIFLKGMNSGETASLTELMLASGESLSFKADQRPIVDKHSTGGVGDKTSLAIAPLLAACGMRVPMISGRGLGHTGGTLDKLESIPGFTINLSKETIQSQVNRLGLALVGQTERMVPADRKLYALRDETGTVESIPLITASILSKKLAESLDALVLDVKYGRGAFMPTREDAEALAKSIVSTGALLGLKTRALITDMNSPVGRMVGNSLEVIECIEFLKGNYSDDMEELIFGLCHELLVEFEMTTNIAESYELLKAKIKDGSALEKMRQMIESQGGDAGVIDEYDRFPQAPVVEDYFHEESEPLWVSAVDARMIGNLIMELGAGRRNATDRINPAVGLSELVQVGDCLNPGDLLVRLHLSSGSEIGRVKSAIRSAITFSKTPVERPTRLYRKEN